MSLLGPEAVPDVEQVQLRIWLAGHGLASGLNIPNMLPKNQVLRVVQKRRFSLADGEYLMVFTQIRPAAQID